MIASIGLLSRRDNAGRGPRAAPCLRSRSRARPRAEWKDSGGALLYGYEYDYDRVGNRLSLVYNGQATYYSYNAANELTAEETPGVETVYYTYDGRGNQIERSVLGGETLYFEYNSRNLITRIDSTEGGFTPNTFEYNALGQRIRKTDSTGTTYYVWDGLNITHEHDGAGNVTRRYTHGHTPIHGVFSLIDVEDVLASAHYFYHLDQVGGVRRLTDRWQNAIKAYEYSPFGRLLADTGSAPNEFTFPATYSMLHDHADLRLSPARLCDARAGAFAGRDPVRSNPPYSYARRNPVNALDPSGTDPAALLRQRVREHFAANMRMVNPIVRSVLNMEVAYSSILFALELRLPSSRIQFRNTEGDTNARYWPRVPHEPNFLVSGQLHIYKKPGAPDFTTKEEAVASADVTTLVHEAFHLWADIGTVGLWSGRLTTAQDEAACGVFMWYLGNVRPVFVDHTAKIYGLIRERRCAEAKRMWKAYRLLYYNGLLGAEVTLAGDKLTEQDVEFVEREFHLMISPARLGPYFDQLATDYKCMDPDRKGVAGDDCWCQFPACHPAMEDVVASVAWVLRAVSVRAASLIGP